MPCRRPLSWAGGSVRNPLAAEEAHFAARFRARRFEYGATVSGTDRLEGTTPHAITRSHGKLGEIVYRSGASVAPDTILEL